MTPDEWEVAAENVDIGGCSLENPMDLISTSYEALHEGDLPDMDVSNDIPVEPGDVSHVGFISEIEESEIALEGTSHTEKHQCLCIQARLRAAYNPASQVQTS